jgi:hypothetical protein
MGLQNRSFAEGGVAETGLVAGQRKAVLIQNVSDTPMWFNFHDTAAPDQGFTLYAYQSRTMYRRDWGELINGALSVFCEFGNKNYVIESADL